MLQRFPTHPGPHAQPPSSPQLPWPLHGFCAPPAHSSEQLAPRNPRVQVQLPLREGRGVSD